MSITNDIVLSTIYDKRDDFNFDFIINVQFLNGDVPRSPSYGVYISQLIRFASVCSNVDGFASVCSIVDGFASMCSNVDGSNNRNIFLTAKLLKQSYRYHKIQKAYSKF